MFIISLTTCSEHWGFSSELVLVEVENSITVSVSSALMTSWSPLSAAGESAGGWISAAGGWMSAAAQNTAGNFGENLTSGEVSDDLYVSTQNAESLTLTGWRNSDTADFSSGCRIQKWRFKYSRPRHAESQSHSPPLIMCTHTLNTHCH